MRGNTKKPPINLNAAEIKLTQVFYFRTGKIYTAKTPLGDFQVTTPETPLFSQQIVTSKGIPIPYTNLQLNPYPNIQLDLFCSDSSSS